MALELFVITIKGSGNESRKTIHVLSEEGDLAGAVRTCQKDINVVGSGVRVSARPLSMRTTDAIAPILNTYACDTELMPINPYVDENTKYNKGISLPIFDEELDYEPYHGEE